MAYAQISAGKGISVFQIKLIAFVLRNSSILIKIRSRLWFAIVQFSRSKNYYLKLYKGYWHLQIFNSKKKRKIKASVQQFLIERQELGIKYRTRQQVISLQNNFDYSLLMFHFLTNPLYQQKVSRFALKIFGMDIQRKKIGFQQMKKVCLIIIMEY